MSQKSKDNAEIERIITTLDDLYRAEFFFRRGGTKIGNQRHRRDMASTKDVSPDA